MQGKFITPPAHLQEEVREFLRRHPMPLVITDCELYYNQRNGISISEYWKGPIEVSDCVIVGNLEYGLSITGIVKLDMTDKLSLARLDPYKK